MSLPIRVVTDHTFRHSARQSQNPRPNDAIFPIEHLHAALDSATYAQNDGVRATVTTC